MFSEVFLLTLFLSPDLEEAGKKSSTSNSLKIYLWTWNKISWSLFILNITESYVSFPCICPVIDHEFRHNIVQVSVDPQCFLTKTNYEIVRSLSLMHRIHYKFMCLSAYWQWSLANERARISDVIATSHRAWNLIVKTLLWQLSVYLNYKAAKRNSSYCSYQRFDIETRWKGKFCFDPIASFCMPF